MSIHESHVFAEIEIKAIRERVWKVLTDFEKMPEWSSSFQGVAGEFKKGGNATGYKKTRERIATRIIL